ncbi:MAG: hypothetical protein M1827_003868 [Pycnora praestabilis]|nr:MAG: hypothetical protein M1827_003868 [Pycnora praestabilis]
MTLLTYSLSHLPPDLAIHIALYEEVQNAAFLRQQLMSGNSAFEYAFIDASVVVSTTHVLSAVFRAVNDMRSEKLKSRNVHSEIVFSLSMNNNIAESFRRFGISDATTSLLIIKVSTHPSITHESIQQHLQSTIEGSELRFSDETLNAKTDLARVRKIYKLHAPSNSGAGGGKGKGGVTGQMNGIEGHKSAEEERKELEVAVLGLIALRGAA